MTHSVDVVNQSLALAGEGLNTSEVARRLGVPRATVRDWLAGRLPRDFHRVGAGCSECGGAHDLETLPPAYVYLLGMWLGDGCLSEHPRRACSRSTVADASMSGGSSWSSGSASSSRAGRRCSFVD
jgi:hypothetical protein